MCISVFAEQSEDETKLKVSGCTIKGTVPLQGGENCEFIDEYVIVNRCVGAPCKLPKDKVDEVPKFECPDEEPNTPGWVSKKDSEMRIASYFERKGFKVSESRDYSQAMKASDKGQNVFFVRENTINVDDFVKKLNEYKKTQKTKRTAVVFQKSDNKIKKVYKIENGDYVGLSSIHDAVDGCPVSQGEKK